MTRRRGKYVDPDYPSVSGRTREGAFLRGVREELIRHVGGRPTPPQRALIEAAAWLRLRISIMDEQFAAAGSQSEHDSKVYLAWVNSLGRLMVRLDSLKDGSAPRAPSLADIDWTGPAPPAPSQAAA